MQQVQQVKKFRNPRAGKNPQGGHTKDIKVTAKKSFNKITAPISKSMGNFDDVVMNELKEQMNKVKKKEEYMILDRMKHFQIQQADTIQACAGWNENLLSEHVHADSGAIAYVQKMHSFKTHEEVGEGKLILVSDQNAVVHQEDLGSELHLTKLVPNECH